MVSKNVARDIMESCLTNLGIKKTDRQLLLDAFSSISHLMTCEHQELLLKCPVDIESAEKLKDFLDI